MNTRALLIDDDAAWSEANGPKLSEELQKNDFPTPEIIWLNPHTFPKDDELIEEVANRAKDERWDAILIDINLGRGQEQLTALLLPFKLIETFRQFNHTAVALIYSGTIEIHLRRLFKQMGTDPEKAIRKEAEDHIRNVLFRQVTGFFSRDNVLAEVVGELRNAPWPLRIERKLLETPHISIEEGQLSEVFPMTFQEVADKIRQGNPIGGRALSMIAKFGIAAIADIFE